MRYLSDQLAVQLRSMTPKGWLVAALLVMLVAFSCGSPSQDDGSGAAADEPAAAESAEGAEGGTEAWTLKQASYTAGVSQMVGITGRKCDAPVTVQVLREGQPVKGEVVDFRLTSVPSKAQGAKLSKQRVTTDAEGKARVHITVGDAEGDYLVEAFHRGSIRGAEPVVTQVRALTPGWIAFLCFNLLGGLGLFLYGMTIAGDHLQKVAGNQMRVLIKKLTRTKIMGVIVGTAASAVLQSSSAATVMLVGFVSATMMTLTQAITVMLGTKIGVTITTQLIAFNISKYALLIVGTGAVLIIAAGKREKMMHIGAIVLGFGLLFFGLSIMSGAMKPLRGMPEFATMLLSFGESPGLGIIVGALFTAIIQSAAAMVAMSMALGNEGLLPVGAAIPLAIGASIGTCATALLACFGATTDGKRLAVAHLIFSMAAALLIYPFMSYFVALTQAFTDMMGSDSTARGIANGFMLYSIITGFIFLPLVGVLEKIVRRLIPDAKGETAFGPKFINDAALKAPLMALDQAQKEVERMAELLGDTLRASVPAVVEEDKEQLEALAAEIEKLGILEKAIRLFLGKLAQKGLSAGDAARERAMIYMTEDIHGAAAHLDREVLGPGLAVAGADHGLSEEGAAELQRFHEKMVDKIDRILEGIRTGDHSHAERVLQLSFKEKALQRRLRRAHLERLSSGNKADFESSSEHLAILHGLSLVGLKLDGVAEKILEEM